MAERILIVDDDVELCELVGEYLSGEGFAVEAVHNGPKGVLRALSGEFSLAIFDIMLPGLNGLEALKRIRAAPSRIPILILTARGAEAVDRIVGLELGADDYLGKPFHPRELVARIRAILRRGSAGETPATVSAARERFTVGDVVLDTGARSATCRGQMLSLTAVEFDVLATLLRSAGQVVTREALVRAALGRRLLPYDRSIDMHVSNLRRKLGVPTGDFVKTVRSVGYLYALPAMDAVA